MTRFLAGTDARPTPPSWTPDTVEDVSSLVTRACLLILRRSERAPGEARRRAEEPATTRALRGARRVPSSRREDQETRLRPLLGRRLRTAELIAVDVLLAVALSLTAGYAALQEKATGAHEPGAVSVVTGVLVAAPLAVRRLRPLTVLTGIIGVSAVAMLVGIIPDYAAVPVFLAIACALYTVAVQRPRRVSVPALIGSLAAGTALFVGLIVTGQDDATGPAEIGFVGSLVTAAWVLGRAARERRAHAARAARHQTEQAVIDERLRIARELHDIVAHSMTLIAVKAAVGNHVAQAKPEEARDALRVIEATSRSALAEIRRALGILRDGSPAADLYSPAPDLTDLAALTDRAAAAGVQLDLTVTGNNDLPQDVRLSVYRIMQEALTNVIQHAAPARCQAVVAIEPAEILIEVTDDGRRPATLNGGGHGLIGIRERVSMYGGRFAAGPRPEGGFRVTARLPYPPQT